jgi:tRNA nucleotidyltransferase (CCA-adding enzyme)
VTLEADLARRDFTVNAMARDAEGGTAAAIIDPYGGRADLAARLLRHVSPAFAEDPVRILRGARFVARFGFVLAPETRALMRRMSEAGEVDALVPERVWQEFSRGLMESAPQAMLVVLAQCGALDRIAAELVPFDAGAEPIRALAAAALMGLALPQRYATLCAGLAADAVATLGARLRAPSDCRDMAMLAVRNRAAFIAADSLDAAALTELVRACDGLRQPQRFLALVDVAAAIAAGAASRSDYSRARACLATALSAVRGIDAGKIAATATTPAGIQAALRVAREKAVAEALATSRSQGFLS